MAITDMAALSNRERHAIKRGKDPGRGRDQSERQSDSFAKLTVVMRGGKEVTIYWTYDYDPWQTSDDDPEGVPEKITDTLPIKRIFAVLDANNNEPVKYDEDKIRRLVPTTVRKDWERERMCYVETL